MADVGEQEAVGEKEATKPPSPKPDTQDVSPPLISMKTDEKKKVVTKSQPVPAKGPAKKNIVLSGEAMKEMQKQAKANREERRGMMDARYTYLFTQVATAIGTEPAAVEDFILSDDRFNLIEEFLKADGTKKLMMFYQANGDSQKKLFLTTGDAEGLHGSCLYFLRTTTKAIVINNIAQEVSFGSLDCSKGKVLDGCEKYLSKVVLPALKSLEQWGTESNGGNTQGDFLEQLEKFISNLLAARKNMEGQVSLEENGIGAIVDEMTGPADYQVAASNTDILEKMETLLGTWSKQIEQVLAQSEQMRREADDIGPTAELAYWKSRMAKFNNLLEQIKSPRVKAVVGVLQIAKSKTLRKWKDLDGRITDAANEAKDNVKYLYTLDKFFGPLVKCTPASMVEHIPSLMNAIRMIYSISGYYNSPERMTSLFVKVTNQMITTCKAYIKQDVSRVWDHTRPVLLQRLGDCINLNEEYQKQFQRTKEKLRENPHETRQFEFSENYIFGKFDTFCKRLERLTDMVNTMEMFADLSNVKIEGIDTITVKYKTIVDNTKKKNYDVLDHRKGEFDTDYLEFRSQIDGLRQLMQTFMDGWFARSLTTEKAVELLEKFESIKGSQLDMNEKYMKVLFNYGRDLETVRKIYQKYKSEPMIPRNLPPVAGRIAWARQLYRKIENPMKIFKTKPEILKHPEAKKIVRNYNKMAGVLLEYELLYHRGWSRAVEAALSGLHASLLVRHPETSELYVNFDHQIIELIQEAKCLQALNLDIPTQTKELIIKEETIKSNNVALCEMLNAYKMICEGIPQVLMPMFMPLRSRVEKCLVEGLNSLSWSSLNIDSFIERCYEEMEELERISKTVNDILTCRIEDVLQDMSVTALCDLPEDEAVSMLQFLDLTTEIVSCASQSLSFQSQLVEKAVYEIIELLSSVLDEKDKVGLSAEEGYACAHPESKSKKQRCQECQPCSHYGMLNYFTQRNTEALVKCSRLSLDAIKRRLQTSNKYAKDHAKDDAKPPLFCADIVLQIPNVVMKPSLDELQISLSKAVLIVLKMSQDIPQWDHLMLHQKQQQKEIEMLAAEQGEESVKMMPTTTIKPLHKIISEHKDIVKIVIQLNSIISTFKMDVQDVLEHFTKYSHLWSKEPEEAVKEFMETKPIMTEIEAQIRFYQKLEVEIEEIEGSYRVGSVIFITDPLKLALMTEAKHWKMCYAKALNQKCALEMDEILDFFDSVSKKIGRPVKDLDDIRAHMAALMDIRAAEVRIDMTIGPIEESYTVLNKYNILFNDGNAERVDSLTYGWKKISDQAHEVQNHLLSIQPEFKASLLEGVTQFTNDSTDFVKDYDCKVQQKMEYRPEESIRSSHNLPARFDELYRKFQTYSGG
ncbi:hypothetical protein ScPMuIL_012234 [Solemya velum]